MSIFYDPTGCDDGPAIVRELEGGDTHPIAVPLNDCTRIELRLMAAAPQMLAALDAALESLDAIDVPQEWDCRSVIRAAISNATGGVRSQKLR